MPLHGGEALPECEQDPCLGTTEALLGRPQALLQVLRRGADQLRRGRWRCAPHIGGQVGDGQVDLVADAGDDGGDGAADGTSEGLVVEGLQVLQRPSAPRQDQDIALRPLTGQIQGGDEALRRPLTLHLRRIDQDRQGGKSPSQHGEQIANRGPRR